MKVEDYLGYCHQYHHIEGKTLYDFALELEQELAELKAKPDPQLKQATRLYNQGYMAGHEDTVEAVFTPLVNADMETYHSDVVEEIIKELEENP